MAGIRNYQTDYLRQGKEQINYKVFDSSGTYVETVDENILVNCPSDLVPLNKNLVKLYEKPMLETKFTTELASLNYINQNGQFLYDGDGWTLGTSGLGHTAPEIIEANDYTVKPLSGNKYVRANGTGVADLMIKTDISENTVRQGYPIQFGFSYYLEDNNAAITGKYRYDIRAKIDASGNGTTDRIYNFDSNQWETDTGQTYKFSILNDVTGKWVGFNKVIEPFFYDSDENDKGIEISISFPNNVALGDITYIDNFVIGEKIDFNFAKMTAIRKRFSYDGGFTGKYETRNIMSNELKDDDNFVGQIEGTFERPRDTNPKTLEAIITQEIMNDSRDYMTKYEGTFRNINNTNVGLHNKLWIDFGTNLLQEPVSCYLDSLKFDVKAGQYDIRMHTPNQDDDVLSTYKVIAE